MESKQVSNATPCARASETVSTAIDLLRRLLVELGCENSDSSVSHVQTSPDSVCSSQAQAHRATSATPEASQKAQETQSAKTEWSYVPTPSVRCKCVWGLVLSPFDEVFVDDQIPSCSASAVKAEMSSLDSGMSAKDYVTGKLCKTFSVFNMFSESRQRITPVYQLLSETIGNEVNGKFIGKKCVWRTSSREGMDEELRVECTEVSAPLVLALLEALSQVILTYLDRIGSLHFSNVSYSDDHEHLSVTFTLTFKHTLIGSGHNTMCIKTRQTLYEKELTVPLFTADLPEFTTMHVHDAAPFVLMWLSRIVEDSQ